MKLQPRRPRSYLALALPVVASLAIAGCSSSGNSSSPSGGDGSGTTDSSGVTTYASEADIIKAARAEGGELNIYQGSDDLVWDKAFKKKYPWVKINQTDLEPNQAAQKWATELSAGVHNMDVINTYVTQHDQFTSEPGKVQPLIVPNDKLVPKMYQDPTHQYHVFQLTPSALLYNTKLLPNGGPEDLLDLAKPEWKGKLVIDNPTDGGASALAMAVVKKELGGDEAKWEEYMKAVVANEPEITDSTSTSYDDLVRGERALCLCSYHDYVSQAKGTPVAADIENQKSTGLAQQANLLMAAKDAPHPAMAALWINWMLDPTGGQAQVVDTGRQASVPSATNGKSTALPPGTKVAPFTSLGSYISDPNPYNDTYQSIWGS